MREFRPYFCTMFALVVAAFVGCGGDDGPVSVSGPPPATGGAHNDDEEHQGPHDGHVIELGRNHEYHAELVDDHETGAVTVYILDKDLKELAIPATSVAINLSVDGQAQSYQLTATEPVDGSASRFDVVSKPLVEALEGEAKGKLSVNINGTPVTGEIEHHDHDH